MCNYLEIAPLTPLDTTSSLHWYLWPWKGIIYIIHIECKPKIFIHISVLAERIKKPNEQIVSKIIDE